MGGKKPRQQESRVAPMVVVAVLGLVSIAAAALLVGGIVWSQHPRPETLSYELVKTCMQVFAVTLVGAVAATAAFAIQQTIADKVAQLAEGREGERLRKQREEDFDREGRRRQDDLVRSMLDDTVNAYHRVKNVRRSLRAIVGKSGKGVLSIEEYDTWISALSEQQLAFEELKRLAPLANGALEGLAPPSVPDAKDKYPSDDNSVGRAFDQIEAYLNTMVKEHRDAHNAVKAAGSTALQNPALAQLAEFVSHGIRSGVSERVTEVIKVLREALLRPL